MKGVLDPKTSKRIFDLARDQQDELEGQEDSDEDSAAETEGKHAAFLQPRSTNVVDDEDDDLGGNSGDELLEEEEYPELVSRRTQFSK